MSTPHLSTECVLHHDLVVDFDCPAPRPAIVVLCGSTRFGSAYRDAMLRETVAGKIVLSIGCDLRSDHELWPDEGTRARLKTAMDELHLRKIELADSVLVLNVGGYVGDSTRREIEHATKLGKPVRYLEPVTPPTGER